MLPRARKAAEGTTKSTATATATNANTMARYRATDRQDIDPASHRSRRVGGVGRRGEEDKEVRSQGTEGTVNLDLGQFRAEL